MTPDFVMDAIGALLEALASVFLLSVIFLGCCWLVAAAVPAGIALCHWWQQVSPFKSARRAVHKPRS